MPKISAGIYILPIGENLPRPSGFPGPPRGGKVEGSFEIFCPSALPHFPWSEPDIRLTGLESPASLRTYRAASASLNLILIIVVGAIPRAV